MKPIPRHGKSIEIELTNVITKDVCFRITIPLTIQRDVNISKFYKNLKPTIADGEGVSVDRISAKHQVIDSEKVSRILYEWRGGIALDMPDDASAYDYSIVLAQLEVLKMGFKKSETHPV